MICKQETKKNIHIEEHTGRTCEEETNYVPSFAPDFF